MKAKQLLRERHALTEVSFAELVIWQLPSALVGSEHSFKYRLAYVVEEVCVLRYDNEAGKGDHRHLDGLESAYAFTTPAQLLADFWLDIDERSAR